MSISLEQLQAHLLQVSQQVTKHQEYMQALTQDMQTSRDMLESLLKHFTASQKPQLENELSEWHIELSERLEHNEDQLAELKESFGEHLRTLEGGVDNVAEQISFLSNHMQSLSSAEQVENLKSKVTGLVQKSHFEESLKDLDKRLNKLTRTQFKTNNLTESQGKHFEKTLETLQDVATRRDAREQNFFEEVRQENKQIYQEARGEFAATLLPVLDGLEAALGSVERFFKEQEVSFDVPKDKVDALMPDSPKEPESAEKTRGFFARRSDEAYQREYQKYKEEDKVFKRLLKLRDDLESLYTQSFTSLLSDEHENNKKALSGWLEGLNLVRERFVRLLSEEEIVPIEPLGEKFDPRLHYAFEAVERDDLTSDTVTQVIRKGYKQGERILRFAEVVVARAKKIVAPAEEPQLGEVESEPVEVTQDIHVGTGIEENIEEKLLDPDLLEEDSVKILPTELDSEDQDEAIEPSELPISNLTFPKEGTEKDPFDTADVLLEGLDQQKDTTTTEPVETSAVDAKLVYSSEELTDLVEESKTPALEILPTGDEVVETSELALENDLAKDSVMMGDKPHAELDEENQNMLEYSSETLDLQSDLPVGSPNENVDSDPLEASAEEAAGQEKETIPDSADFEGEQASSKEDSTVK